MTGLQGFQQGNLEQSSGLVASARPRPRRILYLIGSLETGGAESQLLELVRRLDRSQFVPHLVLFDVRGQQRAEDLFLSLHGLSIDSGGYSRFRVKGAKALRAVVHLRSIIKEIKPDVVHAFLPAACIMAAAACRFKDRPALVASRRSLVDCYRSNFVMTMLDRLATRAADRVIGNSFAVTEEIENLDRIDRLKIDHITNGVDTLRFNHLGRIQRHANFPSGAVLFGMVANFIPYKRHIDFVDAASEIVKKLPLARFLLVGEDRGTLPAVKSRIHELGMDHLFEIIEGTRTPELIYRNIDVFITTSETEGLSNVILEAAASGLPIIAMDVGGNSEIVRDGINGYLVSRRTPSDVAKKAILLGKTEQLRVQFGLESRLIAERDFSLDEMVRSHERTYDIALQQKENFV